MSHALRFLASFLVVSAAVPAQLAARLPFGDGAVLQRGKPNVVRGSGAAPGTVVAARVSWKRDATIEGKAGTDGSWALTLPSGDGGGPQEIEVRCGEERFLVKDLLLGEVWLCSGQSNMEWRMHQNVRGSEEATRAAIASGLDIRHLKIEHRAAASPAAEASGAWKAFTEENAGRFSAVGFFFAAEIAAKTGAAVGIVDASWGGTPVEAWMRGDVLRKVGGFDAALDRADAVAATRPAATLPNPAPSTLWNGMVAPLVPATFRGVLWYQGESNVKRAAAYPAQFGAMIEDWRARFDAPELPFFFVQIAPFAYAGDKGEAAELRIAQEAVWRSTPHTGMVATSDCGDPKDIHPADKATVGRRLAAWAMSRLYGGKDVRCEPPRLRDATFADGTARVRFEFGEGLKTSDGLAPTCFEIQSADGAWSPAAARIDKNEIVVSAPGTDPVAVRFSFGAADAPNLMNAAGLPPGPFRASK